MNMRSIRLTLASLLTAGLVCAMGATAFAQDGVETLKVDPVHSNVLFRVHHFGAGYVFGEFLGESGTIKFDPDKPSASSFKIEMPVESIETHNKKRNDHLKSSSFFDAKQFPKITFESTSVKKRGEDTYEVTGKLTMHGTTKKVTSLVMQTGAGKDPQGNFRRGFYTTLNIKRSDFGIDYMTGGVSDNVKLIIAVETVRQ